jgi:hypothetical protein
VLGEAPQSGAAKHESRFTRASAREPRAGRDEAMVRTAHAQATPVDLTSLGYHETEGLRSTARSVSLMCSQTSRREPHRPPSRARCDGQRERRAKISWGTALGANAFAFLEIFDIVEEHREQHGRARVVVLAAPNQCLVFFPRSPLRVLMATWRPSADCSATHDVLATGAHDSVGAPAPPNDLGQWIPSSSAHAIRLKHSKRRATISREPRKRGLSLLRAGRTAIALPTATRRMRPPTSGGVGGQSGDSRQTRSKARRGAYEAGRNAPRSRKRRAEARKPTSLLTLR